MLPPVSPQTLLPSLANWALPIERVCAPAVVSYTHLDVYKRQVLCHGRMMGVVHAHKATKEQLGLMMTGALDLTEKDGKIAGIAKDTNIKEEEATD